jgi:hypothetical protein
MNLKSRSKHNNATNACQDLLNHRGQIEVVATMDNKGYRKKTIKGENRNCNYQRIEGTLLS